MTIEQRQKNLIEEIEYISKKYKGFTFDDKSDGQPFTKRLMEIFRKHVINYLDKYFLITIHGLNEVEIESIKEKCMIRTQELINERLG